MELYKKDTEGLSLFSGTSHGLFGKLFDKGRFDDITKIYEKLSSTFFDRFYLRNSKAWR